MYIHLILQIDQIEPKFPHWKQPIVVTISLHKCRMLYNSKHKLIVVPKIQNIQLRLIWVASPSLFYIEKNSVTQITDMGAYWKCDEKFWFSFAKKHRKMSPRTIAVINIHFKMCSSFRFLILKAYLIQRIFGHVLWTVAVVT